MLEFNQREFIGIKSAGEFFYKSIGEVYCTYLKEKVSFNTRGLEHLKFKRLEKARSEQDQYMRFKLIHLVPEVLKLSHTVQGILETKKFERVRVNNRTDNILNTVTCHEFVSVVKRNKDKVIVE